MKLARQQLPVIDSAIDVFQESDAVIVGTDWPAFAKMDFSAARRLLRRPLIFDGRYLLSREDLTLAGFEYRRVGRPTRDLRRPNGSHVGG